MLSASITEVVKLKILERYLESRGGRKNKSGFMSG